MADCDTLERCCTSNRTVSSNLTDSATNIGTVKLIGLSNLTVNQILRGEVRVLTGPPIQRGIAQPG